MSGGEGVKYEAADQALLQAVPELRPCLERLMTDWAELDDDPPGNYILFEPYRVWLDVVARFASGDAAAREITRRALDFGETMIASGEGALASLGIDACAETLCAVPDGNLVAESLGGPHLRHWMSQFCPSGVGDRPDRDDIIDLWGTREALAACVPRIALPDLPGITQPADHHRLDTLAEARTNSDGVVILHTYDKSGMFVLARASLVQCGSDVLNELARELAPARYPADTGVQTRGEPGASYFTIPADERVWNMRIGSERHARLPLDTSLWVTPELIDRQHEIRTRLFQP